MLKSYARFVILSVVALVVVVVYTGIRDLTNLPKLSLLTFGTCFALPILLQKEVGLFKSNNLKLAGPFLFFILVMSILTLRTDQRYLSFFGTYGRNNGWLLYFNFTVFLLLALFTFNLNSTVKFFNLLIILGAITSIYGFLQYLGLDFLTYQNSSLPVTGTMGNPNFASSLIGIANIALIWKITDANMWYVKILLSGILIFQVYVILISNSTQGFFIILIGGTLYLSTRYLLQSRKVFNLFICVYLLLVFLGFLGLLQKGPLAKYVYQESTSYRGDFYRAAWRMFKDQPLFGVGIDQFGSYYRMYRDLDGALRLGPDTVSNYAHNIFLQIASTGGITLLASYFLLTFFILFCAIKNFKKPGGQNRGIFACIFSIWIAYMLQAQVSIDQIGIGLIGWVSGGILLALSLREPIAPSSQSLYTSSRINGDFPLQVAGSAILVLITTLIFYPVWKADRNSYLARTTKGDLNNPVFINSIRSFVLESTASAPFYLQYKLDGIPILYNINKLEDARMLAEDAIKIDSNSYLSLIYAAAIYERLGEYNKAIALRIRASQVDKFNVVNWLALGRNYSILQKYDEIERLIEELEPLSSKSTITDDLKALLPAVPTS